MLTRRRTRPGLTAAVLLAACAAPLRGDTFVYLDRAGETRTVEARLLGSGQDYHALAQRDGQVLLVPQVAVQKREAADGPQALSPAEMVTVLEEHFGANRVSAQVQKPYVVAFVRVAPLDRRGESRLKGFLQKTCRFMRSVDSMFGEFARSMRFPLRDPEYPLVTIIFESDDDFNRFTEENTGGQGISARRISGFYSPLTNWLAIRLEECHTFKVPLHEAIHQQMYNRVLQRLAATPKWFDEGIATGFENNGERIDVHPAKINSMYAFLAQNAEANNVTWKDIVTDDASFGGDVLASESYVEAWALHWMLVTQRPDRYHDYVQKLAAREPLQEVDGEARTREFEEAFGTTVDELAADFPRALEAGLRRQKVRFPARPPAGVSMMNESLAEVRMTAIRDAASGRLRVEGTLSNTSPLRALTYHVAVISGDGIYADWVVPGLEVNKSAPLPAQLAAKYLPSPTGRPAETFVVRVKWVVPGSEEAQQWERAAPVPEE